MKSLILSLGVAVLLWVSAYGQFCDPPGEFVGTTLYPIQSVGGSTNRIAVDALGGIHITWTLSGIESRPRFVYYNFRNENNSWLGGTRVGEGNGAAYPSLALNLINAATIAYHDVDSPFERIWLAIDLVRGFGIFETFPVPNTLPNGSRAIWPHISVSPNGDIHILMKEWESGPGDFRDLLYTRSEDGGGSWIDPALVDTITAFSASITAAPNGEVAITYLHPTDNDGDGDYVGNLCYFKSPDGRGWDFYDPLCFTDYENDDLDIFSVGEIDAVMDLEGNLNIVWLAIDSSDNATQLWYFTDRTWETMMISEMTDPDLTCEPGRLQMSMPTVSVDSTGAVEVIYVGFVDTDVSSEGACVGDLYMVYGSNFGEDWIGPFNITQTHSSGCLPGDCFSEGQPSTAEVAADSVYLTYIMQKFGDVQDTVYYMPVEVPARLAVDDGADLPKSFRLYGNYPNPFNSSTTIRFETVENGYANLTIYDITGAKVATLVDGDMEAGVHAVSWNADGSASGVYYYMLTSDAGSQAKKMVYLK